MTRLPLNLGPAEKTALALIVGVGLALTVPSELHHPLRRARHLLPGGNPRH